MMEEPSNLGRGQAFSSAPPVPAAVGAPAWNFAAAPPPIIDDRRDPYMNEAIPHLRDLSNQTNEIFYRDGWAQNVEMISCPLQEQSLGRKMREDENSGDGPSSLQLLLGTLSHGAFHPPADGQFYAGAREIAGLDRPTIGVYSLVLPSETVSASTGMALPSPSLTRGADHALACSKDDGEYLDMRLRVAGNGAFRTTAEADTHDLMVVHEGREANRGNSDLEGNKANTCSGHKRLRVEGRSSLSPFKVRKEKLGDRIAALQQLVAPFGKTDTASVLMEAIGYIKFLQDQVETLSVPYMKSSSKRNNSSHEVSSGEPKLDLRSRGLCLVPLSCTSYVTNDNVCIWPPNFTGGN